MTNLFALILGSAFPALMAATFLAGINETDISRQTKTRYNTWLVIGTSLWTISVWVLSYLGFFEYRGGDVAPRFLVGLMLPVVVALLFFRSQTFIKILGNTPHFMLVGTQVLRLLGISFLFVAEEGIGPAAFSTAGYGDLATGTFALIAAALLLMGSSQATWAVWIFNIAGMFDLLNVSSILLAYYPTWFAGEPSTAMAAEFPTVLILCLAAPIALVFHIFSIRALLLGRRKVTPQYTG